MSFFPCLCRSGCQYLSRQHHLCRRACMGSHGRRHTLVDTCSIVQYYASKLHAPLAHLWWCRLSCMMCPVRKWSSTKRARGQGCPSNAGQLLMICLMLRSRFGFHHKTLNITFHVSQISLVVHQRNQGPFTVEVLSLLRPNHWHTEQHHI